MRGWLEAAIDVGGDGMILIKAIVKNVDIYLDHPESPVYNPNYAENQIKDMLRYDGGTIITKWRVGNEVHFEIKCSWYHPERWRSFGIETRII